MSLMVLTTDALNKYTGRLHHKERSERHAAECLHKAHTLFVTHICIYVAIWYEA